MCNEPISWLMCLRDGKNLLFQSLGISKDNTHVCIISLFYYFGNILQSFCAATSSFSFSFNFQPPEDVVENYEKLEENEFFTSPENEILLRPLLDYFEETWVGRYDHRWQGRRQPMFNVNFWNCYHACHAALPKTNNDVKGH